MKRLLIATTALLGVAVTQTAWAQSQTTNTTIAVTASVDPVCSVTASTLSFLTVPVSTVVNANATINVTCTTGATYEVGLDYGVNFVSTQRKLIKTAGVAVIPYNLYQDAGYTIPWGNSLEVDTKEGTGTGSAVPWTVYGQIPSQGTVTTGVYTDTVTVTVTY
jgi:spore coat protein U-like protein